MSSQTALDREFAAMRGTGREMVAEHAEVLVT